MRTWKLLKFPAKLGYEAAGEIEAVGPEVEGLAVGDLVGVIPAFSMNQYGVYGELVTVPAYAVVKSPNDFTVEQNAAIWMQYITAYGALIDRAHLQAGQTVIITAASSSVGVASVQLAKSIGAQVIAVTRGSSKKDFLLRTWGGPCNRYSGGRSGSPGK